MSARGYEVKRRLALGSVPVFGSDGFLWCFYTLAAHLGGWIDVPGTRKPVWLMDIGQPLEGHRPFPFLSGFLFHLLNMRLP